MNDLFEDLEPEQRVERRVESDAESGTRAPGEVGNSQSTWQAMLGT